MTDAITNDKKTLIILSLSIILSNFYPWCITIGCFVLFWRFRNEKLQKRKGGYSALLILTIGSYVVFGLANGNVTPQISIYYMVTSLLCYYLGTGVLYKFDEDYYLFLLMVIICSLAFPHIVVTIIDIVKVGLVNPERSLTTFGDAESQRSICQRTVELSLAIGAFSFYFYNPTNKIQQISRYVLVSTALLAELCTLHYVSRTGVAILLISTSVGILYKWKLSSKTFLFLLLLLIGYNFMQNTELFSVFSERETDYSNIENVGLRVPRWEWGLEEMQKFPYGSTSYKNAQHPFAHNFWIDFGKIAGYVPFVLLILFSLRNILQSIKVILRNNNLVSYSVLILMVVFYMALFTEPIHEGAPLYMFVYFMFCGITDCLCKKRI